MSHTTDIDLATGDILELGSLDAIVSFFNKLGYNTGERAPLTPEAIGLSGDAAKALKKVELISEDAEGFLRVVFAQSKSLTAKVRNDLARVLGKSTTDHLVVLTSDFTTVEFVVLDKRRKRSKGRAGIERVQVVPKTISVNRRTPTRLDLRILRRFTWTCQDALEQFDKLRSVFDAAAYTGRYFQNRALFSDYFLRERLREDASWRDNPSEMYSHVRDFMQDAPKRWANKEKDDARKELYEPIFKRLGFKPSVNRPSKTGQTQPDYLLKDADDKVLSAAFVYQWDRWLDGPDLNDPDTPEENPGACVVSALDDGIADWIIVTNGRHWRLYGKQATRAVRIFTKWTWSKHYSPRVTPTRTRRSATGGCSSDRKLIVGWVLNPSRLTQDHRTGRVPIPRLNAGSTSCCAAVETMRSDWEIDSRTECSSRFFRISRKDSWKTARSGSVSSHVPPKTNLAKPLKRR